MSEPTIVLGRWETDYPTRVMCLSPSDSISSEDGVGKHGATVQPSTPEATEVYSVSSTKNGEI